MSIIKYTVNKMIEKYIDDKSSNIDARIKTMKFKRAELKVKIKSLAEEARIIKKEERAAIERGNEQYKRVPEQYKILGKYPYSQYYPEGWATRSSLQSHRTVDVRREARHANLAYGFLRGVPYKKIEEKCAWANQPNWNRVRRIAQVFLGLKNNHSEFDRLYHEKFKEWAGLKYFQPLVVHKSPAQIVNEKRNRLFNIF